MNNSRPKIDFKAKQAEFSAYIRNPNSQPCPSDVAPQRMQMYRELFFNNVEGFLSSNFPVLHKILDHKQWQQLAQDFFSQHQSTTPYFSEIPEEFILYLQNERLPHTDDYPFMLELAHYEWVEMALSIAQDTLPEKSDIQTLSQTQKISLSPLTWLLAYQYPVHKISPEYLPTETPEQATYLAVYRDKLDEVKFIELAPMIFHLLQTLQEQQTKLISDCLKEVLPENSSEMLQNAAIEALQQCVDKQLIFAECP
ncbi:MAG: putative DNA-binding domain-containing protein [Methylococcaceae bacterium]|nr:putative DNA-binding domain-containing protein [Methylococcaceae bacterium]